MKILVIGDTCQDIFYYLDCYKLNPECAAIPVGKIIKRTMNHGMAGNVVECIKALEPECEIVFLHQQHEITKERYVELKSNHYFVRIDSEDNIDKFDIEDLYKILDQSFDAVYIADYDKGFLSEDNVEEILRLCYSMGIITIMDTKKQLNNFSNFVTFLKLNEIEFSRNKYAKDFCQNLIVTQGKRGAWYSGKFSNEEFNIPGIEVEVRDCVGAGDSFGVAFLINYIKTNNIKNSLEFANKVASIAVSKPGVYCPKLEDLEK